jgi:hypothetical protein
MVAFKKHLTKKICIFIVGNRGGGKTSTISAMTGCRREGVWNVRSLAGRPLKALVLLSAITERGAKDNPPTEFPDSLESAFFAGKKRNYDILICPFELRTWGKYDLGKYIQSAQVRGSSVNVAVIEKDWRGNPQDITKVVATCRQNGIRPLRIDANGDYNVEAHRLRKAFYPQ